MMTSERRAELKDRWSGGAYEELFAEIDSLLADKAYALQQRVKRLETLLMQVVPQVDCVSPDPCQCLWCNAQAALRGEEVR